MEEEKTVGLVETFDTGELSTELIPPNFTDPDDLFEILKKTVSSYHPSNDLEMINKAYELAKDAHKDQKRKSGEPYLIHPVCVAIILAQPDRPNSGEHPSCGHCRRTHSGCAERTCGNHSR